MKRKCPVCGRLSFKGMSSSFELCKKCNWYDDLYQEEFPDEGHCANIMSLNEAKEAFKKGVKVE